MSLFTVPPSLEPSGRVAVVAPSSGLAAAYPAIYRLGLQRLRDLDVETVEYPTATADSDYLYANPADRARDIERAFRDPDIGAVVATIGGNDQIRLLRHLDIGMLQDHPTRFLGLSDSTVLHAALWSVGVVSFYGGHLLTDFAASDGIPAYSQEHLRRALFDEPASELHPAETFTDDNPDWGRDDYHALEREWEPNPGWSWRSADDRASGRTWGGCLEVLDLLLGADRFVPDSDEDFVLLLETSEEVPRESYVRRMLLGLAERGLLGQAAAVLVGRPMTRAHGEQCPAAERQEYRDRQYDTVEAVVGEYNPDAPVVCGLDFGHTAPTAVPPLGVQVTVDPETETIAFG